MRAFLKSIYIVIVRMLARRHFHVVKTLEFFQNDFDVNTLEWDYNRIAALEMAAIEIRRHGVQGSVAELGVYRGDFAKHINRVFADRHCYLFDTFEGFDPRDVTREREKKYSAGDQNFSDTSVDAVLRRMPHPGQCIVRKGYFPDSAQGLDARYVFVSIDTDLYDPVLAGLEYFYPLLERGGYIFVNDFNNDTYRGACDAVVHFCSAQGIGYFPLADNCGSAIIAK